MRGTLEQDGETASRNCGYRAILRDTAKACATGEEGGLKPPFHAIRRAAVRGVAEVSAVATVVAMLAAPAWGQRRPVLEQIDVPHPYYCRELYLPQLTSGPSSLSWGPDSKELVYSMAGSLWRQRLDSKEAVQLTDGPGYDYQPDWSPDGKNVVYTSYQKDAMELWLLEVGTGKTKPLTGGGAVNVEPRWSPDGNRIVLVSTQYNTVDGERVVLAAGVER